MLVSATHITSIYETFRQNARFHKIAQKSNVMLYKVTFTNKPMEEKIQ